MKVGNWVRRKRWGNIGWVTSIKQGVSVDVQYPNHTSTVHPNLIENYEEILPEVKEDAKRVFVEIALMTRDKELFDYATTKEGQADVC